MDEADEFIARVESAESSCSVSSVTEIVEKLGFWDNPFLEKTHAGTLKAPNVPCVTWWLEHPDMGLSHVGYNEMEGTITAELLPWNPKPHSWTDADSSFLFSELQRMTRSLVKSRPNVADALVIVAHKRSFNPLLDALESLPEWDGVQRADTLLVDFLGAADTEYTRAVTRHLLYGAVSRAYVPGVKFDECVCLVSREQGIGKSTLINKLALSDEFFSDTLGDVSKKEAPENMKGKWLIEIGELEGLRKKDIETIKHFLSRRVDRFRASYGKFSEDRPRRCIFIATTNSTAFLADRTGNRRFLPIMCNVQKPTMNVFAKDADDHIRQVWAEILFEHELNGSLPLVLRDEIKREAEIQRDFFSVDDPTSGIILAWVESHCRRGEYVCIMQLMHEALDIPRNEASKNRALQKDIAQLLDLSPAFERIDGRRKHSDFYGMQRCWEYAPKDNSD